MVIKTSKQRRIVFIGNSLTNYSGSNTVAGRRYPVACYNTVKGSATYPLAYWSYAVPGVLTATLITDYASAIKQNLSPNDIVIFWGITTDIGSGGLDENQAYAKNIEFVNLLLADGMRVINCTMIPRNTTAYYNTGLLVNAMIVANAASVGYTVCDLTADTNFNAQADSLNATYYNADALHLTDTGYDLVASLVSPFAISLL